MSGIFRSYQAIITARNGPVTQLGDEQVGDPEQITYDAVAINTFDSVFVTGVKPVRRVSRGADVIVAQLHDDCTIQVMPDGTKRLFVREGVPFEECP